jgi:uncharacterized membrane protein YczE
MKNNITVAKVLFFLTGLTILSLGINLMTTCANFGLSPWDSLFIALQKNFGLTIGVWMFAVNITMTVIVYINDKREVSLGTLFITVLISVFVDGIGYFIRDYLVQIPDPVAFVTGNVSIGVGIGMYVSAHLMIAPHESFMMMLCKKFNWSYRKADIFASIGAIGVSLVLSGPIFLGTIALTFTTGFIIQFVMNRSKKVLTRLES